jgi:hypothetical protein
MSRKKALERLGGLAPRIEEHLDKITSDPASQDAPHWTREVKSWIQQVESLLPHVGRKTSAKWWAKIADWKAQVPGDEHDQGDTNGTGRTAS